MQFLSLSKIVRSIRHRCWKRVGRRWNVCREEKLSIGKRRGADKQAGRKADAVYPFRDSQATRMSSGLWKNSSNGKVSTNKRNDQPSMKSTGYREYNADRIGRSYLYEDQLNEDTKYQNYTRDSTLILFPFYEENFLLEAIDKIVKKRWRIIDNTTRYGWLAACYYKRTVSPEDAKMLSALGNKIGPENCTEAIERIEILAEKLHPREVPTAAIAILTETDTALMLRQRRGAKASLKLVKDRFPTIFTISDAFAVKRTNVEG